MCESLLAVRGFGHACVMLGVFASIWVLTCGLAVVRVTLADRSRVRYVGRGFRIAIINRFVRFVCVENTAFKIMFNLN